MKVKFEGKNWLLENVTLLTLPTYQYLSPRPHGWYSGLIVLPLIW